MTFSYMMNVVKSFLKRFEVTCVTAFALWVDLILVKFLNFSLYHPSCLARDVLFSLLESSPPNGSRCLKYFACAWVTDIEIILIS